jgi:hypothetical protein
LTAAFCQASKLEALNSKDLDDMAEHFRYKNELVQILGRAPAGLLTNFVIHNY